jgi:long-chain acyl-CoA synthetase
VPATTEADFVDQMVANVALQFLDRVDRSPRREAFRYPVGEGQGERWLSVTWAEAGEQVARYAAGLLALGLEPEQRVGIASGTRYDWILADLAVMCAAGATTTVYPSTNSEDTAYIVGDAECRIVFAEDDAQIAKLRDHKSELPHLGKIVTFEGTTDGDWVIGLEDLGTLGDTYLSEHADAIRETAEKIRPDQLATLIYTSGTTGRPKGVRLRHSSWVYEGSAIQAQDILDESDLEFRWLPMAHSFGKVLMSTQLHVCDRRPRRPDRRQPRRREADVHGSGAADLREGARADRHHAGRRGRRQGGDLQAGVQGRHRARPGRARGPQPRRTPQGAARPVRPAGLRQDP